MSDINFNIALFKARQTKNKQYHHQYQYDPRREGTIAISTDDVDLVTSYSVALENFDRVLRAISDCFEVVVKHVEANPIADYQMFEVPNAIGIIGENFSWAAPVRLHWIEATSAWEVELPGADGKFRQ